ncbi:MAG: PadR family transcriptional regulator, partial [Phycisphaeraceae bacterium]|nr:PadR family transcriptional regulator [Phycisphaeraceae bacterium]
MRIERELMRGAGPVAILKLLDPAPSPETPGMLDSPARTL